jgi:hypothetical protein
MYAMCFFFSSRRLLVARAQPQRTTQIARRSSRGHESQRTRDTDDNATTTATPRRHRDDGATHNTTTYAISASLASFAVGTRAGPLPKLVCGEDGRWESTCDPMESTSERGPPGDADRIVLAKNTLASPSTRAIGENAPRGDAMTSDGRALPKNKTLPVEMLAPVDASFALPYRLLPGVVESQVLRRDAVGVCISRSGCGGCCCVAPCAARSHAGR